MNFIFCISPYPSLFTLSPPSCRIWWRCSCVFAAVEDPLCLIMLVLSACGVERWEPQPQYEKLRLIVFLLLWILLFLSMAELIQLLCCCLFPFNRRRVNPGTKTPRFWGASCGGFEVPITRRCRNWCWIQVVNLRCPLTAWNEPWYGHCS